MRRISVPDLLEPCLLSRAYSCLNSDNNNLKLWKGRGIDFRISSSSPSDNKPGKATHIFFLIKNLP